MKTLNLLKVATLLLVATIATSCEDSNDGPEEKGGKFENGVLIVNEGLFQHSNSSLSFYSNDSAKFYHEVAVSANPEMPQLGDVLQSVAFCNNKTYAVLNNSQKVEVFENEEMTNVATISNLSYPTHAVAVSATELWVGNGNGFSENFILVIDATSDMVVDTIPVSTGPGFMVEKDGKVYVAMQGGWATGNLLTIIDVATRKVEKNITLGDFTSDLVFDATGDLWVLSKGATLYDSDWKVIGSTNARLDRIDVATQNITETFSFDAPLSGYGYNYLDIDATGTQLLFANGALYKMDITATELPTTPIVENVFWYGMSVDPKTSNIWGLNSTIGKGSAIIYDIDGNKLNEYEVGIGPNAALFID